MSDKSTTIVHFGFDYVSWDALEASLSAPNTIVSLEGGKRHDRIEILALLALWSFPRLHGPVYARGCSVEIIDPFIGSIALIDNAKSMITNGLVGNIVAKGVAIALTRHLIGVSALKLQSAGHHSSEFYTLLRVFSELPDAQAFLDAIPETLFRREAPLSVIEVCNNLSGQLIQALKIEPAKLHTIDRHRFEEVVAELLVAQHWDVTINKKSGDGGFDLLGISSERTGIRTHHLIQCKRPDFGNTVDVRVVRELLGVKQKWQGAAGLIVTTARLTSAAIAEMKQQLDMDKKDYEGLIDLLRQYEPKSDGGLYISDKKLARVDIEQLRKHGKIGPQSQ